MSPLLCSPSSMLLLLTVLTAAAGEKLPSTVPKAIVYAFQYGVRDDASGTLYAHSETRQGVTTTGQYTVHLPDGRVQTVKYTADHNGYRATVSYEGVAWHPDRVLEPHHSRTRHFPPVVGGRTVPVVTVPVVPSSHGGTSPVHSSPSGLGTSPVHAPSTLGTSPVHSSNKPSPNVQSIYGNIPTVPPPPPPLPVHHGSRHSHVPKSQVSHVHQSQHSHIPQLSASVRPPVPIFTVPFPSQTPASVVRTHVAPWQSFTQSPTIHRDTKLLPLNNYVNHQNSIRVPNFGYFSGGDSKPLSGSGNIHDFYQFPSSQSTRDRSRIIPANTYIPSAYVPDSPAPIILNNIIHNTAPTNNYRFKPSLPDNKGGINFVPINNHLQGNRSNVHAGLSELIPPYYSHPSPVDDRMLPTQLMPPYKNNNVGVTYQKLTPYLSLPDEQLSSNYGTPQQSISGAGGYLPTQDNSRHPNSIHSSGYLPTKEPSRASTITPPSSTLRIPGSVLIDTHSSIELPDESTPETGPLPIKIPIFRPPSIPSYSNSIEDESSEPMYIPLPQTEQFRKQFTRRPFVFDPDASVFHNHPHIIVDFRHRGTSHEDDSDGVSLTAPYVFVAGSYSPNPEAKFSVHHFQPEEDPNSVASHGIAPPDAADAGNIRLSSGFLPPHLARLHQDDEIGRKSPPTPQPVQIKLGEHRHLPLRNQPSTFGGDERDFSPNSLSLSGRFNRRKRSSIHLRRKETSSAINSRSKNIVDILRQIRSTDSLRKVSSHRNTIANTLSRPLIRNG